MELADGLFESRELGVRCGDLSEIDVLEVLASGKHHNPSIRGVSIHVQVV